MKFKKTKLTALAMSVLMAMSTITSVTWAADLFTDGAPAEVAVEAPADVVSDAEEQVVADKAPVDVISDVEEQDVADEAALTGAAIQSVSFEYDTGDQLTATKVIARFRLNDGSPDIIKDAVFVRNIKKLNNCTTPETAIYKATAEIEPQGSVTIYSDNALSNVGGGGVITSLFRDESGVLHPATVSLSPGEIVVPGSRIKWHIEGRLTHVFESASCSTGGKKAVYRGCSVCGMALDRAGNYVDIDDASWNGVDYSTNGSTQVGNVDITISDIEKNAHNYEGQPAQPLTVDYFDYTGVGGVYPNSPSGLRTRYVLDNGLETLLDYAPFNCVGTQIYDPQDPQNVRDSYYYTFVKCKNCNTIRIVDKVYLRDTSGEKAGDYYEWADGGNVIGFLANNPNAPGARSLRYAYDNSILSHKYGDNIYGQIQSYLPIDAFNKINTDSPYLLTPLTPVLQDCTKDGYYYVRSYVSDTPEAVNTERITVSRVNHVWGSVEVAPNGLRYADGKTSATQNENLLSVNDTNVTLQYPASGAFGFVVVRVNGSVTEAKSKNCITEANYELYHQCLICGRIEKTEAKKAPFNTDRHQWGQWSDPRTDKEDNKYYQIEGEEHDAYHMVYTYYHRTCDLCGKRDLKLAEEKKEAHKLVETKYDNDGEDETYVAPTCGTPGSYDVILRCACGFEDTESRKTTTIPATDQHDFGDNPAELQIIGDIQVGGGQTAGAPAGAEDPDNRVYARIVRKCINCGEYDANGINNTPVGALGDSAYNQVASPVEGRTFSDYVPAKVDPTTHVPYPCSVGQITVNFKWEGKVDGKATRLTGSKTVPYYINRFAFASARAHEPGEAVIENKVDATADTAGSYDVVLYCRVCGDEISRETKTVNPEEIIPVPTAKATAVNYNTINITWNAVEGATSYNVYYRSAALGVNDWTLAKNVTGTSFNYSGLITGVKYRFTVSAVKGENSSEFGVNTSVATPKLAAPEVKTVTAVKKGTKVTWTKVDGANGYIIQSKTASGKWTRVGTVKKGAKVSWIDKKAVSGTTYRVRAYRTVDAPNISKNNVYGPFSAAK